MKNSRNVFIVGLCLFAFCLIGIIGFTGCSDSNPLNSGANQGNNNGNRQYSSNNKKEESPFVNVQKTSNGTYIVEAKGEGIGDYHVKFEITKIETGYYSSELVSPIVKLKIKNLLDETIPSSFDVKIMVRFFEKDEEISSGVIWDFGEISGGKIKQFYALCSVGYRDPYIIYVLEKLDTVTCELSLQYNEKYNKKEKKIAEFPIRKVYTKTNRIND